jgi:hypothetical protein
MSVMPTKFSLEQDIQLGNCAYVPPCLLFGENNRYFIKEGTQTVGIIEEESEKMCRIILPARQRAGVFSIKFNGLEYTAQKQYRCATNDSCSWLCCKRPDIIVRQGDRVVGSVELPCCPAFCFKMELKMYRGEARTPQDNFCNLSKCQLNCHCLTGRTLGCCCDCARFMVFNVTGEGDGYLNKQHHGVINECITNADKYNFEFPSSRPDDMAIYLSSIVFADMLWYEDNYCGLSLKV